MKHYGVTIKYYYTAMKLKIQWISSPRNDMLADSICLLILQINEHTSPPLIQMLELTRQGRKTQEFQLKLQMALQSHFLCTKDLEGGRIQIFLAPDKQYSFVVFNIQELTMEKVVEHGQEVGVVDEDSEVGFLRKTVMDIVLRAEETRVAPGVGKCIH